jgi:hypothetical protein
MSKDSHESHAVAQRLHELERVADVGESGETPFILMGQVWFVVAAVLALMLAVSLIAYYLAS